MVTHMRRFVQFIILIAILTAGAYAYFASYFGAVDSTAKPQVFAIAKGDENNTFTQLEKDGFLRDQRAFRFAWTWKGAKAIQPGGYTISKSMNAWELVEVLTSDPTMKWITFPEGLRKEQIGERLAKLLNWSDEELEKWNTTYTTMKDDYVEGVYYPDTYLIPVDESGLDVAKRMQQRFNEKMAPYMEEFAKQNIKWTTGLKIASLIQREAAGAHDMPLIAGVMWNRLLQGHKLDIDATIQYAKGKVDGQWWSRVTPADIRTIDSPYNTYKYKGLPPHPISNPGMDAIKAVLYPEETDCFFYLHAPDKQIYCAVTYEEHLENIEKYLQ